MRNGFTMIPKAILDKRLSIEAIGLYTWLSANADKKGRVATSRADLSKRTGLSPQQVRTALSKLESTKLITKLSTKLPTKSATTLTISSIEDYKGENQDGNQEDNQVNNQPLSTGLSIEERQSRFYDTLRPYVSKYSAEMLRSFYDYWSEPNRSRTKMRMELEKTWYLSMRLATWHKRDEEHKFKNGKHNRPDTTAETVDAAAAAVAELIASNR